MGCAPTTKNIVTNRLETNSVTWEFAETGTRSQTENMSVINALQAEVTAAPYKNHVVAFRGTLKTAWGLNHIRRTLGVRGV